MVPSSKLLSVAFGISSLLVATALQAAPVPPQGGPEAQEAPVPPCVTVDPPRGIHHRGPHHYYNGPVQPPCVKGAPGWGYRHHPHFYDGPRHFHGPRALPPRMPFEDRLAFLRGSVQPKDAQLPQWNSYEEALIAAHDVKKNLPPPGPEATQQQRLEARIALKKAEVDALENVAKARAELVKVLTPEQIFVLEKIEAKPRKPFDRRPRVAGVPPQGAPKI